MDSFLLSQVFAQASLAQLTTTKKASIFIEASANLYSFVGAEGFEPPTLCL